MAGPDQKFAPADPLLVNQQQPTMPGMTYGRLRQRHPDYDAERMQELHDLHAGGYTIEKSADKYLCQLVNEHDARFAERCRVASYINYFGQIVEQFTSDLFAQPLSITAAADKDNPKTPGDPPDQFYKDFEADADLAGTDFVSLIKHCMETALVQRWAYVCIDAPDGGDTQAVNKAEEEAAGTDRCYAYWLSPRQVIDWKKDKRGPGLQWAVVHQTEQERESPDEVRNTVREIFTVWTLTNGVAHWRRYVIEYDPKVPPKDDAIVPLDDEGDTTFKRIPLLRMELPKGLWVGNKIAGPQKEHWNRRSALIGAENRSMAAIPFVKRGPEISAPGQALPSETQQIPSRGRDPMRKFNSSGHIEIGAEDEIGFAEPHGHCYALVDKELDELKDEIFRVTHQMAASVRPSAGMMGRSAQSKQQDGKATALVLRALGTEARNFSLRIYETIAEGRGDKETIWTANGLDNYELIDREQVIEEAISIDQVPINSPTFKKTYKKQVAGKLLTGMDPRTNAQIDEEIDDSVDAEHELLEIKRDAEKDMIENPPQPVAPTAKVPMAKQPTAKPPTAPKPGKRAA